MSMILMLSKKCKTDALERIKKHKTIHAQQKHIQKKRNTNTHTHNPHGLTPKASPWASFSSVFATVISLSRSFTKRSIIAITPPLSPGDRPFMLLHDIRHASRGKGGLGAHDTSGAPRESNMKTIDIDGLHGSSTDNPWISIAIHDPQLSTYLPFR